MFFNDNIKKIKKILNKVNKYDLETSNLTNKELKQKTQEFKTRLEKETLEDILPEAFAVCREAAFRVLGKKPYDVQVLGGIILHQGKIAEMKTGEGKTLTETMPAYLNALTGESVHIITVNDYLAERDMQEMGKIFKFLGLTVSCIYPQMNPYKKREAYKADIVYGTNKEFGFDYLRDNMAKDIKETFQRGLNFAIIDEVDSILIDEARTPLIISGQGEESTELYEEANYCVKSLIRGEDPKEITKMESILENMEKTELSEEELEKKGDYTVNEKDGTVILTDRGVKKVEKYFDIENLGDFEHSTLSHHVNQALKAHNLMLKDKNYIVKDEQIQLVDDFTGRVLDGRRYSDGLHQAIEAKENVPIQKENNTLATISLQNYFRLYKKITGMTGTAITEKTEFKDIYNMDVVQVSTNLPIIRKDLQDKIYQTEKAKFNAIVTEIKTRATNKQPVLIGTATIEQSERLSNILRKNGIKHNVLNAKNHEKEAEIIAQAGHLGSITIATNMAGRGTDILLGGNPEFLAKKQMLKEDFSEEIIDIASSLLELTNEEEILARNRYLEILKKEKEKAQIEADKVKKVGGLHILGTVKHESRRIDNQLRGRAGRQGDPGSSQFFISLEDDIVRLFAGDKFKLLVEKLKIPEDIAIDNKQLSNMVETAQKRYEIKNFEIRKNTLEYDDVNNGQRQTIYSLRTNILKGKDLSKTLDSMIDYCVDTLVQNTINNKVTNDNIILLQDEIKEFCKTEDCILKYNTNKKDIIQQTNVFIREHYQNKIKELEKQGGNLTQLQQYVLLKIIDKKWISYLTALQNLRDSVSLVAFGNIKPIQAYKQEAFYMFNELIDTIKQETIKALITIIIKRPEPVKMVLSPVSINLDNFEKPKLEKAGEGIALKTKSLMPNNINPLFKKV